MANVTVRAVENGHDGVQYRHAGEVFDVDAKRLEDGTTWFEAVNAKAAGHAPAGDAPNAFLDRTIPEIIADLEVSTDEELSAHLAAEQSGKGRKGVTEAIEKEIEARKA